MFAFTALSEFVYCNTPSAVYICLTQHRCVREGLLKAVLSHPFPQNSEPENWGKKALKSSIKVLLTFEMHHLPSQDAIDGYHSKRQQRCGQQQQLGRVFYTSNLYFYGHDQNGHGWCCSQSVLAAGCQEEAKRNTPILKRNAFPEACQLGWLPTLAL